MYIYANLPFASQKNESFAGRYWSFCSLTAFSHSAPLPRTKCRCHWLFFVVVAVKDSPAVWCFFFYFFFSKVKTQLYSLLCCAQFSSLSVFSHKLFFERSCLTKKIYKNKKKKKPRGYILFFFCGVCLYWGDCGVENKTEGQHTSQESDKTSERRRKKWYHLFSAVEEKISESIRYMLVQQSWSMIFKNKPQSLCSDKNTNKKSVKLASFDLYFYIIVASSVLFSLPKTQPPQNKPVSLLPAGVWQWRPPARTGTPCWPPC